MLAAAYTAVPAASPTANPVMTPGGGTVHAIHLVFCAAAEDGTEIAYPLFPESCMAEISDIRKVSTHFPKISFYILHLFSDYSILTFSQYYLEIPASQ